MSAQYETSRSFVLCVLQEGKADSEAAAAAIIVSRYLCCLPNALALSV